MSKEQVDSEEEEEDDFMNDPEFMLERMDSTEQKKDFSSRFITEDDKRRRVSPRMPEKRQHQNKDQP